MIENDKLREAVLKKIMPAVMDLWQRKNTEYAHVPFMFEELGEVVEITRKAMKLRAQVYLKEGASDFEGPEQVAMDLIGHCLMLIYMLDPDKWDNDNPHHHGFGGKYPHGQHSNSIRLAFHCSDMESHYPHEWTGVPNGPNLWCSGVVSG